MEIKKLRLSDRAIGLTEEPGRNNPQPATTPRTKRRYNVPKTWHTYTDQDKAAALAYLQSKGWRIAEAARDLGVPKGPCKDGPPANGCHPPSARNTAKSRKASRQNSKTSHTNLIDAIPDTIPNASLKDLGAILAVVIDKMRL